MPMMQGGGSNTNTTRIRKRDRGKISILNRRRRKEKTCNTQRQKQTWHERRSMKPRTHDETKHGNRRGQVHCVHVDKRVVVVTEQNDALQVDRDNEVEALWRVSLPCSYALMVCNLLRVFLPVALIRMAPAFGWDMRVQGALMSSFLLGYALTQLPGGRMADSRGARGVLGMALLLCGTVTAMTPLLLNEARPASSLGVLLVSRLLVGMGEGVSMPCVQNLIARNVVRLGSIAHNSQIFLLFTSDD